MLGMELKHKLRTANTMSYRPLARRGQSHWATEVVPQARIVFYLRTTGWYRRCRRLSTDEVGFDNWKDAPLNAKFEVGYAVCGWMLMTDIIYQSPYGENPCSVPRDTTKPIMPVRDGA